MIETGAEIALHRISKKDEKPLVYRAVKPKAVTQRGLLFRGHGLIPDHDLHRVSGRQCHHHKDDEADTQKDGHELKKAFEKLSDAHARYPRLVSDYSTQASCRLMRLSALGFQPDRRFDTP